MKQGTNEERVNNSMWQLLVLLSSNTHVMDFLSGARKHASQGEMFRLLELKMNKKLKWAHDEAKTLGLLKDNYGVVGRELIRWLVSNRETARNLYLEVHERVKEEFQANDDERYWTAGNACIITIIQLLGKKYANLIDIPINPIVEVLRGMVVSARSTIYGSRRNAEDILNAYTREHYGKFVVVKIVDGVQSAMLGSGGEIDQSITRTSVAGRVEHGFTPGHINYYIEIQLIKAHCVAMSYGYSDFKEQLEKLPQFKVEECRPNMLSRTRGPMLRVNALKISRPITEDDEET
jgi:hypothetical protein